MSFRTFFLIASLVTSLNAQKIIKFGMNLIYLNKFVKKNMGENVRNFLRFVTFCGFGQVRCIELKIEFVVLVQLFDQMNQMIEKPKLCVCVSLFGRKT